MRREADATASRARAGRPTFGLKTITPAGKRSVGKPDRLHQIGVARDDARELEFTLESVVDQERSEVYVGAFSLKSITLTDFEGSSTSRLQTRFPWPFRSQSEAGSHPRSSRRARPARAARARGARTRPCHCRIASSSSLSGCSASSSGAGDLLASPPPRDLGIDVTNGAVVLALAEPAAVAAVSASGCLVGDPRPEAAHPESAVARWVITWRARMVLA
jgi:hypothetical protein